jgi:hypothetical protein
MSKRRDLEVHGGTTAGQAAFSVMNVTCLNPGLSWKRVTAAFWLPTVGTDAEVVGGWMDGGEEIQEDKRLVATVRCQVRGESSNRVDDKEDTQMSKSEEGGGRNREGNDRLIGIGDSVQPEPQAWLFPQRHATTTFCLTHVNSISRKLAKLKGVEHVATEDKIRWNGENSICVS